jgi:hypothetical protein
VKAHRRPHSAPRAAPRTPQSQAFGLVMPKPGAPNHPLSRAATQRHAQFNVEHIANGPAPASGSGPSLRSFMLRSRASSTPSPWGLHGGSPAPPAGPPQGVRSGVHQLLMPSNAGSNPACSGLASLRSARR